MRLIDYHIHYPPKNININHKIGIEIPPQRSICAVARNTQKTVPHIYAAADDDDGATPDASQIAHLHDVANYTCLCCIVFCGVSRSVYIYTI